MGAYSLLLVVLILLVAISAATLLRIPVPLTVVKSPIERVLEHFLERPVVIDGPIELKTSLHPQCTIHGLRLGNPKDFQTDTFLQLGSAEIELELRPLLRKKLHLAKVLLNDVTVTLEETPDGQVNWVRPDAAAERQQWQREVPEAEPAGDSAERLSATGRLQDDSIVVRDLRMQNIHFFSYGPDSVSAADARTEAFFHVEKCAGTMLPGEPARLSMTGKLIGQPYTLDISLASLREFIETDFTWTELELTVVETVFKFRGEVSLAESHNELLLEASISGENLRSLDSLLRLDLPPFKGYEMTGRLRLTDQALHLGDVLIKIGSSSLGGNLLVTKRRGLYEVGMNLDSPMIQLDDFIFPDWSWQRTGSTGSEGAAENGIAGKDGKGSGESLRRLTDAELLKYLDAFCIIQAQAVRSGKDELGRGILSLTIKDGRLALEPVQLNIPGGRIILQASIRPGAQDSEASLSAKISNFDIGVLTRRKDPVSEMGGLVNLDAALHATTGTLTGLFEQGSGHFDFSGQLKNVKAGAVDLWAVNLLTAMLTSTESSRSEVNCAVGRWTVRDGILTPDVLFVDTEKIRICASGKVDLTDNSLQLLVRPTPKRAEYFNVATPVEIKGNFDDVKVGVAGGGILGSAVRFVTSPVFTPLKRIVTKEIPADGSDVCNMALGAQAREDMRVPGCN